MNGFIKKLIKNGVFLVMLFFLCFMAILLNTAFAEDYNLYNPRLYNIEYRAEIINISDSSIKKITVKIPLIKDNFPNQKIEILDIVPREYEISENEGQQEIVYKIRELKPKEKVVLAVRCKARVYDVFYSVDFNRFSSVNYDENNLFLKPQEYIESDSMLVKYFAGKIAYGEKNPYLICLRFYDYLRQNINFDFRAGLRGAETALKNKLVGCSDAASLYTALCRSYGIPARYCAGFYLGNIDMDDNIWHTITDTHAWSEVLIDNNTILPVDPTQGRFNRMRQFQCFARQGNEYIMLWKDKADPVAVSCKDKKRSKDLYVDFYGFIRKENIKTQISTPRIFKTICYEKAAKNKSAGIEVKNEYSRALNYIRLKDYSNALKTLKNIMNKYKTETSQIDNTIGYVYLQTHNYEEAYKYFTKSIFLNRKNIAAYENMINLFNYLKIYDESLKWIEPAKKKATSAAE